MLHAPSRNNNILNWQHRLCKKPHPITDVTTLHVDHTYAVSNGALTPSPLFQPQVGPVAGSPAGWLANPDTPVQHAAPTASLFPPLNTDLACRTNSS